MSKKSQSKKKQYKKPELKKFGSVRDLTLTSSQGAPGDGGSGTYSRVGMTMCVSAPAEIEEHQVLLADTENQTRFRAAIQKAVKQGDIVVDLGVGNGLHTLFALEAGAKKVYAIESGDIVHVAREVIERNGFADRVEFIHGYSQMVELPEKADVLVSNIGFLFYLKCLPDAFRRMLKPGGRMIPASVRMGVGMIEDHEFFDQRIAFWDRAHFGFDFQPLKKMAAHHPHYLRFQPEQYLGSPSELPPIDFAVWNGEALSYKIEMQAARDGVMHGLAGYYEFLDGSEVVVSTKPPARGSAMLWNNFVLPLNEPLNLKRGDRIECELSLDVKLLADSAMWNWTVAVNDGAPARQSSFQAIHL